MKTLSDLTGATGRPVDVHLLLDLVIPLSDGLQAQGDLMVVPLDELAGQVRVPDGAEWREVPPDGVELLRGAAGDNAHTLVADPGTCLWTSDVEDVTGLAIGVLDAMAAAYLLHREHGGTGLAPGRYAVRRQREHAPPVSVGARPDWLPPGGHRDVPRSLSTPLAHRPAGSVRLVAD